MGRKWVAIANCRVSSKEQLLSNSLNRQQLSVEGAAKRLGVEIVKTWSGNVSSKAGTNVKRKDLNEMLEFCKKHKNVKYVIFDEYDRFMRSVNEGPYFEVLFQIQGAKVWYASESDAFNGDDATAKLQRSMSAYRAEGSNEERQHKSIAGLAAALKEGRYPFYPKAGYMRGAESGIHEIHPIKGPALQTILKDIVSRHTTPSQGLVELNKSAFIIDHNPYKMDKFRRIITDPFYAGIVEMDKQIKVRNEKGLHEPLISLEQHLELVDIMDKKKKNQSGPRKGGNPRFPLNNIVSCKECLSMPYGRVVGFANTNGQYPKIYEKYRCRSCKRYIHREELHSEVAQRFQDHPISKEGINDLIKALDVVWKKNEGRNEQESHRIGHQIESLEAGVRRQASAAIDPSNTTIKKEILENIESDKEHIKELEDRLTSLKDTGEQDRDQFLQFAFSFINDMGSRFFELTPDKRDSCKQIIFPGGFILGADKKVYTPEISPLIRLAAKKKDTVVSEKSHMVQHLEKSFHEISGEIGRWRDILAVPYQEYLLSK